MISRQARDLPLGAKQIVAVAIALVALAALTFPFRNALFLGISGVAVSFDIVGVIAEIATEPGLFALVAFTAALTIFAWWRDRAALLRLSCSGVGVILAYLISEGLKLLIAEQRPCRAMETTIVQACPSVGDWSWPSNHSVIAAAFATACVLAAPRTAWMVVPAAALIGTSRVAVGAHYCHDVLSGFALGILSVLLCVIALRPLASHFAFGGSASHLPEESPEEMPR